MTILCLPFVCIIGYALGFVLMVLLCAVALVLYVLFGWWFWLTGCNVQLWNWQGPGSWIGTDLYMKFMFLAYQSVLLNWEAPSTTPQFISIQRLKPKGPLQKKGIDWSLNIEVPVSAEDEFSAPPVCWKEWLSENMSKFLPTSDDLTPFAPDEDPVAYVMGCIGNVYPTIREDWSDKQSDRALTRFVLYGLGAHRIETTVEDGKQYYIVRTNALAGLPVRDKFACYGGDAYFSQQWIPVKIVDAGFEPGETVVFRPGDAGWSHAKFRFRSSLSVLVTVVDHLFGTHLQASNVFLIAMREQLSPHHPMRRFLTPFTFGTVVVNDDARKNLIQPGTMGPRNFALTKKGLALAFTAAPSLCMTSMEVPRSEGGLHHNRLAYFDYLKGRGIDTEYTRQARRLYDIFFKFVSGYLECYYPTPEALVADEELKAMFKQTASMSLLPLARASIDPSKTDAASVAEAWKHDLANFMWVVTAGHEQTGAIQAFVQDPTFCAFKWLPGQNIAPKESALLQALLMSFTSQSMPQLMGSDWTYLFPPTLKVPGARANADPAAVFAAFQAELHDMAHYCDQYNATAPHRPFPECFPLFVLNPRYLETSIAV